MLSVLFYHSLSYSLEPCRGLVNPGNPQSWGFSCAQLQQLARGARDLHSGLHAFIASVLTHSAIFPTIVLYSVFKDSAVYLFSV